MTPMGAAPRDDTELVAGVLAGDRTAFAGVYEKYANRLHDFAFSMLRNREEAADCVADSFVVMAEKLEQLRDPSRLRPWLYSVVRNECLRTLRARARVAHDDEWLAAMPDQGAGPEEIVGQEEEHEALRDLVWSAIEGLNDRDRSLLDLHLRQGLDGAELAAAMDMTPANSYVVLSRAKDQVERSLGALLIARRGSDDCTDLSTLLAGWDGRFSPLIRKRVARHIDTCDVCETRRRLLVSPLAAFAGVPAFAAPLSLRDKVLEDPRLVAFYADDATDLAVAAAGGSGPAGGSHRVRRAALLGVLVLLLVLGGIAAVAWWPNGDGEGATAVDPGPPATSSAQGVPTTAVSVAPSAVDSVTAPAESTAVPDEQSASTSDPVVAAPAELEVTNRMLQLGADGSSGSIGLRNVGGTALDHTVAARAGWLSVSRSGGSIDAGGSTSVKVTANRGALAEGMHRGQVAITWSGGTVLVTVRLTVDRPPTIGAISHAGTDCTARSIAATVTDGTGLGSVRVGWSGPSGTGEEPMALSGGRWRASIGPFPIGGGVTVTVTAKDTAGHTTTRSSTFHVDPCPG